MNYGDYMNQLRIVNGLHKDVLLYTRQDKREEVAAVQRKLVEAELKLAEITEALREQGKSKTGV